MTTSSLPGIARTVDTIASNGSLSSSLALSISFEPSLPLVYGLFEALSEDIRSFRIPLERSVRQVLVPSIRRNFEEGGRPTWEALSDATLLFREFYGFDKAPLIRTGRLERVATQINMWNVDTLQATMNDLPDKVWYGIIQQEGTGSSGTSAKTEAFAPVRTPDQIRASGKKVTSLLSTRW